MHMIGNCKRMYGKYLENIFPFISIKQNIFKNIFTTVVKCILNGNGRRKMDDSEKVFTILKDDQGKLYQMLLQDVLVFINDRTDYEKRTYPSVPSGYSMIKTELEIIMDKNQVRTIKMKE